MRLQKPTGSTCLFRRLCSDELSTAASLEKLSKHKVGLWLLAEIKALQCLMNFLKLTELTI